MIAVSNPAFFSGGGGRNEVEECVPMRAGHCEQ